MTWLFAPETLNAVLVISISLVTLATVYALIYVAFVFQKVNKVLSTYRGIIKRLEDGLSFVRDRMDNSAKYLGTLTEGVKEVAAMLGFSKKKKRK